MRWKLLDADKRILCQHTEGGMNERAVDPSWALGCHCFFDEYAQQWCVSVDDDGIAWTWCHA